VAGELWSLGQVVVVGQPGSGIAATALDEGRMARVTGIVRRPYPTAIDRRYAITPRSAADLRILGAAVGAAQGSGTSTRTGQTGGSAGQPEAGDAANAGTMDADLLDLPACLVGRCESVGLSSTCCPSACCSTTGPPGIVLRGARRPAAAPGAG
jgi:hypothetical protein